MSDVTKNVTGASGGALGTGTTSAGLNVNTSARIVSNLKNDDAIGNGLTGNLLNQSFEKPANEIGNTKIANLDPKATSLYPLSQIATNELAQKAGEILKGTLATTLPAKTFLLQQGG